MVAKFQYGLPAIAGLLSTADINRVNAVFLKARKWGLTRIVPEANDLIDKADKKLFRVVLDPAHCRHSLLPLIRDTHGRSLRKRGHNLTLPLVRTELHKESFITRCLFKYSLV